MKEEKNKNYNTYVITVTTVKIGEETTKDRCCIKGVE